MLTRIEKFRKSELLDRYKRNSVLSPQEIMELKDLLNRDDELSEGAKLILLLGLGALLAYVSSKK
ncbi:MAG: hypothetical protein KAJ91_03880 [Candidatus Aenigmarchaeota archaeon]|nr:hypothetical protein [Candidatus Aenigmarchaeota archaeon]